MSQYTIEIRHLKNTNFPFDEYMKDYPIWDENYRKVLNNKILDHYYFREIAYETPDRFGIRLRTKLNEIMPFYNELYKSLVLDFNPLYNIDYTETTTGEKDTKSNTLSNNTSSNENISDNTTNSDLAGNTKSNNNSSTNQGKTRTETVGSDIGSGQISQTYLNSGQYANNHMITENAPSTDTTNTNSNSENTQTNKISYSGSDTGSSKSTNDTDSTGTENSIFEKVIKGYSGQNPNQAIKEFRQNILNIDMMIIEELSPLFFGLLN